ncbi:cilia- and flagella-associated protein HOATZ [Siniperca chuatsi]|uniref:cilia- and flagella-associated protein HOATZ n=1 Tax=Siniperca chuatsi TaxID=119488 RepID=UPI001CE12329|nr:cilia- and flagella-associated protein HOATZ [Siniperca chuatsi]
MSAQAAEQEELDKFFTVFDGSSPEDVSHARQLWSSLSLLPPAESRLVTADVRQRLPVSRPQHGGSTAPAPGAKPSAPQPPSVHALRQRQEERQRYVTMADQRREILALLRRQREQRIQKELLSVAFKPKVKVGREKMSKLQKPSDSEKMDKELVNQLQ